jgi:putative ABC transport system permease protein
LHDDVGFATSQLFTFKTNLTAAAYPDLPHANRFYDQLTAKLEALPGVAAVAGVSYLPLSGESEFFSAAPVGIAQPAATVAWRVVRGPYFSTMGSNLRKGRFFNDADRAGAPLVAIVDDAFARRFWPDEAAALGRSVRFGTGPDAQVRTIVGIVHHLKHFGPGQASLPEAFVPQAQFYKRGMYTVMKTNTAASLAPLVRARLAEVDPAIPMYFIETMERRYAGTLALPRFTAGLVGTFSALALVLAGVGIFGVTAYSVAQRSREFGIRFALGAQRSHVVTLVLGRVGRLALLGGAIGGVAAYELAQLMGSLLFGVEPTDAPTLVAAAIVVAGTALAASLVPLARALRVNPADALRAE